ncbi:Hemolysin, contains CBS domains [Leifsonia sp. 98AMF]|uniref:hemolysin family protein n=1 Tax=unclassified Leifsonia TaxID=2663824 RepID=UPI00087DA3B0|nr:MULTISPECIES: hemolysin family protein [unclassified Leifsonia]SDH32040.1 Hemolysin, contains CBS domains [Leifsonia sp. 197AMF]SDJ02742.1 Hemolysin, contains CBS domains [Leifsonia sp. 466MF]SDJ70401.1 Hemolysin, contains CBS domains [Leifsonia sp. 157MF]SDO06448.1 Hemolysin, contains CBS domains [Leifsonia sp. 509MF]SEM97519.1 Hemolysin, contains CBS domains [Leifsonia sp. 467MF]
MLQALFFIVAFLLVAFGGLMAAVDSALAVQSRADIADLAETSRAKKSLRAIAEDPGAYFNAISFTRIIAETTAAVLVTLAFEQIFEQWWISLILAALIMTAVSFVLVGVSPRSVGRANSTLLLRLTAPIVRFVRVVLGPIPGGLVALGNRVTPSRARSAPVTSEEQLLSIVDEATEFDVLEEDDRELIHSIFEFNATVVREVMIPRTDMITVDSTAGLGTAMGLFFSTGVSRMPVIDGGDPDEVVGILYLRDAAKLSFERPLGADELTVRDLARPALFVPESQKADALLAQMQRESNHLAMVVDEYGGIAGLVTLEDLIEELVGDISDEYDHEVALIQAIGEGRYRIATRLPIDDLAELFDTEIEEEDVDSVGGLVTKALGRLPEVGSAVTVHGLRFTVDRIEGRHKHVATVIVERDAALLPAADAETAGSRDSRDDDRRAARHDRHGDTRHGDNRHGDVGDSRRDTRHTQESRS